MQITEEALTDIGSVLKRNIYCTRHKRIDDTRTIILFWEHETDRSNGIQLMEE